MKENYNDILDRVELIIKAIPTLAKENNEEKNEKLLKEVEFYKDIVKNIITKKFPIKPNNKIKKYNDKLNILLRYETLLKADIDIGESLEINKYLYRLDNPDTLEQYNKDLLDILKVLLDRKLLVNGNTFNYNRHTKKYMNSFLRETKNEDIIQFNKNMKNVFDGIYWENRNLLKDISRNFKRVLLINNDILKEKSLEEIEKLEEKFGLNKDTYLMEIANIKLAIDNLIQTDPFYIVKKYVVLMLNLNDFKMDEEEINNTINKFMPLNYFNKLDEQSKDNFYENILLLSNDIYEYKMVQEFSFFIDEIIKNYKNYKVKYDDKLVDYKELQQNQIRVETELTENYNEHKKTLSKKTSPIFTERMKINKLSKLDKKIKKLNEDSETISTQLDKLEKELQKAKFEQYIKNNINEDSSMYDIFNVYQNNYYELAETIKTYKTLNITELQNKIEEFKEFINGSYSINIKNIRYSEYKKFGNIIVDKYSNAKINIKLENLDDINYINSLNLLSFYRNIKKANLTPDEINYYINYLKKIK